MARPKGLSKTGGRVLGTPNKATIALARKLARLKCDPIEGLARIALDSATETSLKVRRFAELAQYVYPKRKSVDLASPEDSELTVRVRMIGSPVDFSEETI
jgi:hypothetical protein